MTLDRIIGFILPAQAVGGVLVAGLVVSTDDPLRFAPTPYAE